MLLADNFNRADGALGPSIDAISWSSFFFPGVNELPTDAQIVSNRAQFTNPNSLAGMMFEAPITVPTTVDVDVIVSPDPPLFYGPGGSIVAICNAGDMLISGGFAAGEPGGLSLTVELLFPETPTQISASTPTGGTSRTAHLTMELTANTVSISDGSDSLSFDFVALGFPPVADGFVGLTSHFLVRSQAVVAFDNWAMLGDIPGPPEFGLGDCVYTVVDGIGRISSQLADTSDPGLNGIVEEIPFDWDFVSDVPEVFVLDLPTQTPDIDLTGDVIQARVTTGVPAIDQSAGGSTRISLSDPTELGTSSRQLKWRVRISDVLADPLAPLTLTYLTYDYYRQLSADLDPVYSYFRTPAQVAAGGYDDGLAGHESASFGAFVDVWGWTVTMLGNGHATFGLNGTDHVPTQAFTPTTDWYIVETMESQAGSWGARIYRDGDTPPPFLTDSTSANPFPPGQTSLFLNVNLLRSDPFYVEYDWIQVFSGPPGALPPQPDGRLCEYPPFTDFTRVETALDFIPNTLEVWVNGITQRAGTDFHEHPAEPTGSPDDRDHFFLLTSPRAESDSVYICYTQVVS